MNKTERKKTGIDAVIKDYGGNIRNLIVSFVGAKHFQDIQQEVYIKIWKNLPKYQDNGKLGGWIKAITMNTCRDHLKSKQFRQEKDTNAEDDSFTNVKDSRISPDVAVLQTERQKMIVNAIERLKPKFKEVIILYDIDELSYEEISKKVKCPVGTVKSRLFGARKQLQIELADLLNE